MSHFMQIVLIVHSSLHNLGLPSLWGEESWAPTCCDSSLSGLRLAAGDGWLALGKLRCSWRHGRWAHGEWAHGTIWVVVASIHNSVRDFELSGGEGRRSCFCQRNGALARDRWNLWMRSESLSQVIRCWKQTMIAGWAMCMPTWCYTDVSCHLTDGWACA